MSARTALGYGKFSISPGIWKSAHRISWELEHGPIPKGKCVLHHCDNPPCVRPSHLFLGTKADNNEDMRKKGRKYSKLKAHWIKEIRVMLAAGMSMQKIADLYGVSQGLISHVKHGRAWTHIP
jgi:hypothetical protein